MGSTREGRLRVGFVGGGRVADLQVLGWLEHPRAEVGAICDVDAATRERRAREWGATAYARLEDLLADPTIDAVEILTPHHLHAEQAFAALEASPRPVGSGQGRAGRCRLRRPPGASTPSSAAAA